MWICYCIYEWVVSFTTVGHNATFTQSQLTVVNNATLWWHKCCVVHNSVSSQCCVWWHNEWEMWVVWMLRYSHNSELWLCECCVVSSHIRCEMTLWWHNSHLTLWDSLWGVMTQRMWDVSCVNVALFTTVSCDCDVITTHCCVTVYMNESCHSHGWLNSFICVTCLIRTCDMPHWHEWGMSHIWTN